MSAVACGTPSAALRAPSIFLCCCRLRRCHAALKAFSPHLAFPRLFFSPSFFFPFCVALPHLPQLCISPPHGLFSLRAPFTHVFNRWKLMCVCVFFLFRLPPLLLLHRCLLLSLFFFSLSSSLSVAPSHFWMLFLAHSLIILQVRRYNLFFSSLIFFYLFLWLFFFFFFVVPSVLLLLLAGIMLWIRLFFFCFFLRQVQGHFHA